MAELLESIGHNIRRLREEKGWNQTELGFHADMSPSIISLIENGKRNPSTATLAKIAGALGVEVVDLFPKGTRRSSLEPTLLNGLEEERRASGVAEAIVAAADRWGADVADPDIPESRRNELIKVATELGDLIGSRLDEDDWAAIPLQERREIAMTTAKLDKVASRGTSQMNEETRKRMAKALDKAESRKKFREWNRATQQESA